MLVGPRCMGSSFLGGRLAGCMGCGFPLRELLAVKGCCCCRCLLLASELLFLLLLLLVLPTLPLRIRGSNCSLLRGGHLDLEERTRHSPRRDGQLKGGAARGLDLQERSEGEGGGGEPVG